jgi:uncharacterized protein YndB with AHSA1/START domain
MDSGVPYSFRTRWRVTSPIEPVFAAIRDSTAYPAWWKAVLDVERVEAGGDDGIGRVDRFTWRAPLGYRLRFTLRVTTVDPPTRLGGDASGELEGRGDWTLRAEDARHTLVQYDWNVRTRRRWMNAVAPLARPVFRHSHDAVMRDGATGLAALLDTRVVDLSG